MSKKNIVLLMALSTMSIMDCSAEQSNEIAPAEMINQYSALPRTVSADAIKSKQIAAPRKHMSKLQFAGINSKTAHLSTLDNEAVIQARQPKP